MLEAGKGNEDKTLRTKKVRTRDDDDNGCVNSFSPSRFSTVDDVEASKFIRSALVGSYQQQQNELN
jgi:hypothetical protein